MASSRDCLSCTCGHITLEVVKGDLTSEKADAIVCTATKNLDLSRGRISRAMLTAAGSVLQEDCSIGYPEGIEYGQVAVVNPGNLPCERVLLVAFPVWTKGEREKQILEDTIKNCILFAHENNLKSLSLPALGTGLLKYPLEVVTHTTLKCLEHFSRKHPKSSLKHVIVVVFHKDTETFEAFEKQMGSTSKSTKEDSNHKLQLLPNMANLSPGEMGMRSIMAGRSISVDESDSQISIEVVVDTFPCSKLKTDVLVNIMKDPINVDKNEFYTSLQKTAGEDVKAEIRQQYRHGLQPGDIATTGTFKLRRLKRLYHCYLSKSEKQYTTQKYLQAIVENCLQQTSKDSFKSVAFPAPVIDNLSHKDCAKVMCHTIKNYEDEMSDNCITRVFIFVVKSEKYDWTEMKDIYEEAIAKYTQAEENKQQDSANASLYLSLESALKGALERSDKGPTRGTPEWFKFMYKREPRPPSYWSHFNSTKTIKEWHMGLDDVRISIVPVQGLHFVQIDKLVQDTWQSQHVGQGRDSAGLGDLKYSKIKVTKIERIENTILFEKYIQTRQELFRKVIRRGKFQLLKDLPNAKGPILTTQSIDMDSVLTEDIYAEVNEHYMFHGTQDAIVHVIAEHGLDSRLAGSSTMFGQGVYAAESSTKADQYADDRNVRSKYNRKMFLIRMCLGKIHIQASPENFARPPCSGCVQAKCSCGASNYCDSVIGEGSWIFREFVVYDRSQVYPEYIITYDRV